MTGLLDLAAIVLSGLLVDVVFWTQKKPPPVDPPTAFDEMYAGLDERFVEASRPKRSHRRRSF